MKKIFWKVVFKIRYFFAGFFREEKIQKMRKQLMNHEFSIIASNCCGAILAHDLGMRLNSPTVNCFFEAKDFVKLCENLEYYMTVDPVFLYTSDEGYPVCGLDDIRIYAMHYKSAKEFSDAWCRRRKRINYDQLFIMMTDRDGFTDELLARLNKIKYKKVLFSHKKYEDYPFVCYVKCFRHSTQVGDMFKYADIFGNRYYEKFFDCIEWLNGGV